MQGRTPIGYVVQVDGGQVTLNLLDQHRGQMASHQKGVSSVTDIGGMLAIDGGHRLLVLKITGLNFAEPKEVHRLGSQRSRSTDEPLRHMSGVIVGWIEGSIDERDFFADSLVTPSLGAEAFPLIQQEMVVILGGRNPDGPIRIGTEYRTGNAVKVGLNQLLAQHVAVLGSSGQGKSCFTAAVMQQLASMPRARIVIFDINGEYDRAFKKSEAAIADGDHDYRLPDGEYKHTAIGSSIDGSDELKIPYYALGRQGLHRLLLPSEKTQRPALSFAVDQLKFVEWHPGVGGVSLVGAAPVLFDDCRPGGAAPASTAIETLRSGRAVVAARWPHMSALAALVAESHSLSPGRNGPERNAFFYGNVAPLITRIHRLVDDEMLKAVVDVTGGASASGASALDWQTESDYLVGQIFGTNESRWRVHVVNLRQVPQDLMPLVLGSLLELYAYVLFRRGQGNNPATLLVLEEAHHYLRPVSDASESQSSALAYERLAKEGRKFGLSLWLSTQRPSEVSPTVLSQCSTWVTFRLTTDQDLRAISAACEWADPREVKRIAGLPRQHALILGGSVAMPTCIKAPTANPTPKSEDGPFDRWADDAIAEPPNAEQQGH